ncbi:uncharacterized protein LOC112575245 isoform X3 [Pomacea canaliculata]|uniref:uncharacterized protein LOC112575245 isoform X3 n=1 Tax=Pomacea canaliculata TaxID=400727 RepID=UPI000D73991B|nr:uncharacterized protein LOC112575245 isoform X3 [Pomacea canaliculata]
MPRSSKGRQVKIARPVCLQSSGFSDHQYSVKHSQETVAPTNCSSEGDMSELSVSYDVPEAVEEVSLSETDSCTTRDPKPSLTFVIIPSSSQRGRAKLCDSAGFTYVVRHIRNGITTWRCSIRNKTMICPASVKQNGEEFVAGSGVHSHEPKNGVELALKVSAEVKRKCAEDVFRNASDIAYEVLSTMVPWGDAPALHALPAPANLIKKGSRMQQRLKRGYLTTLNLKQKQKPTPAEIPCEDDVAENTNMNRGMRDNYGGELSRVRQLGGGGYGSLGGNYGGQSERGGGYGGQGLLGSSPGLMGHSRAGGGGGGGSSSSYGMGNSNLDMDTLMQQRSLQQQLSLRESQLALANSLLQQQSQMLDGPGLGMRGTPLGLGGFGIGGGMMNKRRQDMSLSGYQSDYKRPRRDFQSPHRDRRRSREGNGSSRGSSTRKNTNMSSSRRSSEQASAVASRSRSTDAYDPEKPTSDDEEKSTQLAARMKAEEHLRKIEVKEKNGKGFCKICDQVLEVRYSDHIRMAFHRKRVIQVMRGCGWCGVEKFANFTEVLAHRDTEEHKKNQAEHEKNQDKEGKSRNGRSKQVKDSQKKPEKEKGRKEVEIQIKLPAKFDKFDPEVAVGQSCVVPVSGFFCKLCNKFFNNETSAKDAHCKTEAHFTKYKKFLYAKLKAKAQADKEAAEKAAKEDGDKQKEGQEDDKETTRNEGDDDIHDHDDIMEEVEEDASEDPAGKVEGDAVEQVVADEDGGQEEPEIGDELQEREEYSQETGDSEQLHTEEQDEDSMLEGDPADAMYEYNEEPLEEDSLLKEMTQESAIFTTADEDNAALSSIADAEPTPSDSKLEADLSLIGGSNSELLTSREDDDEMIISLSVEEGSEETESPQKSEEVSPEKPPPTSTSTPTRGGSTGRGRGGGRGRRGRRGAK